MDFVKSEDGLLRDAEKISVKKEIQLPGIVICFIYILIKPSCNKMFVTVENNSESVVSCRLLIYSLILKILFK